MADDDNNKQFRSKRPLPPPLRYTRNVMGWIVFAVLAALLVTFLLNGMDKRVEILPGELLNYAKNGQVVQDPPMVLKADRIEGQLNLDKIEGRFKTSSPKFYVNINSPETARGFIDELRAAMPAGFKWAPPPSWLDQSLPWILLYVLLLVGLWYVIGRRFSQAGGGGGMFGNFGRSRHRVMTKEIVNITFKDVAGIEDAKEEVSEIIEFLRNPRKFAKIGGRIPRGVLLVGEPGCGKTLMAKAIAGEADVPFFSISGSDFVEMFVGVGASRVRDLFRQAKESSPCIIFLDEIDAVGRKRVNDMHGGSQENAQTLNAILVEMDGFDSSDQVIVLAATNRVDVLDPALTRPGRFDRQVQVPLPDVKGRYDILKIYINKVKCGPDVDLQRLARGTPMFSGADLAALVNEAAIAATMAGKDFIEQCDLEEARDKVCWGRARKSRVIDEKEKEITAFHEAGHALVQILTPGTDPLHKVSIIPRGPMGGATFSLPEKDRYLYTRSYCNALLRVTMGGRMSEELCCNDISSGASNDIAQATDIARRMVLDWGMSEKLGFVRYSPSNHSAAFDLGQKEYSDSTAQIIDEEVKAFMDSADRDTRALLEANRDNLKRLAEALLKYETLDAEEVKAIVAGQRLDKPSVNDLLDQEHRKTQAPASGSDDKPRTAEGAGPVMPEPA